ncbi:MAG: hypothetical protein JXR96_09880 [Deltaproteobacteria bacterium]|nr:hypothetical protein [Deltaproteobacteria bacterium]
MISLCAVCAVQACSGSDGPESRVYLEEESPNSFTAFYLVESPAGENGDWGPNIVGDYETMEEYSWKMFRFEPGVYDVRLEWVVEYSDWGTTQEDLGKEFSDQHGMKYNASDSGLLFSTSFSFD